ncbi:pleckstrin homology domain-containing family G member 7-like [Saccostrea echinata]|uniref:pleckstrin homology domain-containing family G member 7-like n=1 Tax=Saccostrea echinata TaxID=191078 RepID=UPI002A809CC5|nr:pleckstrin homology domain-containing family G member 7-like [Saccostrea echinata]
MSSLLRLRKRKEGSLGPGGSEYEDSGDLTSDDGKLEHRLSSSSLTSASSESDSESPSPTQLRRERRPAIFDTKNVGDLICRSTELTPSTSIDEEPDLLKGMISLKRRDSVDLETTTYQADRALRDRRKKLVKRNTIADFYKHDPNLDPNGTEYRRGRQTFPFSFNKLIRARSKDEITKLSEALATLTPSKFSDNDLSGYKSFHWSDLIARTENDEKPLKLPDIERKRREAIWELFTSECVFLIDHLMVLKHCFMEPLKRLQVDDHLMFAEPNEIFSNLDELCYVSYTFCKELITVLLRSMKSEEIWPASSLVEALDKFSKLSDDGNVYHTYCISYSKCLEYVEKLRKNENFVEFEKWCSLDPRCRRLQLNDFLVAPMQHCTKLPLLLANIRKYTSSDYDKSILALTIGKVEISLQCLDEKMRRERNTQRLQELRQQIMWPIVTDLDPRTYIPECLRSSFSSQPCSSLLSCPHRLLLHEGQLTLIQTTKNVDVYLFLFDDLLLITKTKRGRKKPSDLGQTDNKSFYVVYRQPIELRCLKIHDVDTYDTSGSNIKNALVLVQVSTLQQVIGLYTLQCPSEFTKDMWISKLNDAKSKCYLVRKDPCLEIATSDPVPAKDQSPKTRRRIRMLRNHKKKSISMDTLFTCSE